MEPEWVKIWIAAIALVISIATSIYAWWANKKRDNTKEITDALEPLKTKQEELAEQIYRNKDKLLNHDGQIRNLPNREDLKELIQGQHEISTGLSRFEGKVDVLLQQNRDINQHLLENK